MSEFTTEVKMPSTDAEREAMILADKIVAAGDRGVSPNADDVDALAALVESQSQEVADALRRLREEGSSISVEDMFEMQMLMNRSRQMTELNTGIISAANASMTSMVRNIQG